MINNVHKIMTNGGWKIKMTERVQYFYVMKKTESQIRWNGIIFEFIDNKYLPKINGKPG